MGEEKELWLQDLINGFPMGVACPRFPNYTSALRPDHFQIFAAKTCNLNYNTQVPLNRT